MSDLFERVRQSADYMPFSQVDFQMKKSFGKGWEKHFSKFEKSPFAAASIGQVHRATDVHGNKLAVKIQYPQIDTSIDSDIQNLKMLLPLLRLPREAFLDECIEQVRKELVLETNYLREAKYQSLMRSHFNEDLVVKIPKVYDELTSKHVLTSEMIENALTLDECSQLDQETRNFIARQMIRICFDQLFGLQILQTDPNWSNYFWDPKNSKIWMIDFGATRKYQPEYMNKYIEIINASVNLDREKILKLSQDIGYLTGYESKEMNESHINAVIALGEFIREPGEFDFQNHQAMKSIVKNDVPVFLKHRLKPPPDEVYSMDRATLGVVLTGAKLKAKCHSRDLWTATYNNYHN